MSDTGGGVALKVDLINDSFSQMRISGITVDPTPSDLELALGRLETMAAEWFSRNICADYNFEDEPDPNSYSGVARAYWQAFATNLATRLIPDYNKQVPIELTGQARQSLSNLSARSAAERLEQTQYPSRQPTGSGNTLRYGRWDRFYRRKSQAPNSCATNELTINDVDDYVEHFDAYLNDGEIIESFTIESDAGLVINSSSNNSPDINYNVTADSNSTFGEHQRVVIVATTDTGRITTRVIDFDIADEPQVTSS